HPASRQPCRGGGKAHHAGARREQGAAIQDCCLRRGQSRGGSEQDGRPGVGTRDRRAAVSGIHFLERGTPRGRRLRALQYLRYVMSAVSQPLRAEAIAGEVSSPQVLARPYTLPELRPNEFYVEPLKREQLGDPPIWCVETTDPFDLYSYRVTKVLACQKTAFQNVVIAESCNYGRILFMDGAVQSAQDDEALYHEMLVQPAMILHAEPRDVLIVGGGEGATLREVLAHKSVRTATMVDIDQEAVELCREHLGPWHQGAFEDPRARVFYEDGRGFVERTDALYDVVIIDVVDSFEGGPAERLYTREFYELLRKRLRPGGIVVV